MFKLGDPESCLGPSARRFARPEDGWAGFLGRSRVGKNVSLALLLLEVADGWLPVGEEPLRSSSSHGLTSKSCSSPGSSSR